MLRLAALPFALVAVAYPQEAVDKILEGHSHIGEAFNEGPRQAAYLMDGLDVGVHFPVSTSSELAQRFFDQAVVQLHGFWYFEAERSFRQVAKIDPDCAMAYWGMCLANIENEARAQGFAREAFARKEAAGEHGQLLIEAYARYYRATEELPEGKGYDKPKGEQDQARRQRLIEDLERVVDRSPDDIEVKALLANQLWIDSRDAGQRIRSRQANEALLQQVLAVQPMHPAHHYRVHLWDTTRTAHRVTDSVARIGHAAPAIAHMWHMGGHIWARLDRHDDAAWQQEASARVDHAQMMRDQVMPDQIHNYAHNNEWLSRSLRHVGRVHQSIDLAKNMVELPRHPKWNVPARRSSSSRWGPQRLSETLLTFEAWDEVVVLADTAYLAPADEFGARADFELLLGRAHLERGLRPLAETQLAKLDALLVEAKTARATAMDAAEEAALAEGKGDADAQEAMAAAAKAATRDVRAVRRDHEVLEALLACDAGTFDAGLARLEEAHHDAAHLARLMLAAGRTEDAVARAREAAKDEGRAQPLANLAYVLHAAGKADEARAAFQKLRAMSARFDLDYPPFARLGPLAAELGLPADWRMPYAQPEDTGVRPDLDSLGPFRWAPVHAPDWRLPDGLGNTVSLSDHAGRPVLVVFFLGFGCVHCVEQLQALMPEAAAFEAAGISIVAVGTDALDDLTASQKRAAPEDAYPFPIVADPELGVFRQWRCHDDFEEMPLHGTFLVDAQGRVRWQDIGYEPFMDLAFLLQECQRLLALPIPTDSASPSAGR